MYLILKQTSSAENVWSFYTEAGLLWTATTLDDALAKVDVLIETIPAASLRLVQQIDFDVVVTATPEPEPDPEPEPEPEP